MEHSISTTLPPFDSLWNFKDPAGTEASFRELLPAARQSDDCSYLAQLLTQIARTEGLQRRFDDAHRTLNEAEQVLDDASVVTRIRYLLERGRVYNSSGDRDSAKTFFIKAWECANEADADYYAIDAAHMMVIAAPDEALEWNEHAMKLAERTDDERAKRWLGPLYNNIGWTYHDRGDYEAAMRNFEKCLTWHHERKTGEGEFIARWSVGRTLRSLGKTEQALAQQQQLLADRTAAGAPEDGYVSEEIGECMLALGNADAASPFFATAYRLLSEDQWLQANEAERLERLRSLGT